MNQVGSDFQAGTPITSWKAAALTGCCTANMTRACDRVDVGCEVAHEVRFRQPGEAGGVDVEMCERCGRRTLLQERTDRLALVEPEGGDVDERLLAFGASRPRAVMICPP